MPENFGIDQDDVGVVPGWIKEVALAHEFWSAENPVEEKKKATQSQAEKDRLDKSLSDCDLERAIASDKATDKKAGETKLKAKQTDVEALDKAGTSDRLKKFMDLVNNKHIQPITDYSKEGNGEFYAEAYSLWLVDPHFLQNNYKDIYDFFRLGVGWCLPIPNDNSPSHNLPTGKAGISNKWRPAPSAHGNPGSD